MHLILPIAGSSSRFPDMRPKWMLTHPRGRMMITEAVSKLSLDRFDGVTVVGLETHEREHRFEHALRQEFSQLDGMPPVNVILLDSPTRSQPETVARGLIASGVKGPFYVKDSDNRFRDTPAPENSVTCLDLHSMSMVNASNKSYVAADEHGVIVNIVEKRIISSHFCVGGYGFLSAEDYLHQWELLKDQSNLYISHIVFGLMLAGSQFRMRIASDYDDWGTLSDWNKYKAQYSTLFVDLDGTLVYNSSQHGEPRWGETAAIEGNVAAINALYNSGKVQIILTTSRTEEYRAATERQLDRIELRHHQILFGLLHGRRVVVNDYAATNPYKSCEAINLKRNSGDLREMLEESMGFQIQSD